VAFLVEVLTDRRESTAVRSHVLRRLRDGRLLATARPLVVEALLHIIPDGARPELRLQAVLALGDFVDLGWRAVRARQHHPR
jgi:hypothetical protein